MKKQKLFYFIILGVYLIASIIISLALSKETINLMVISIELFIIFLIIIFYAILFILQYNKILNLFNNKDNIMVINKGNRFIKFYLNCMLKQYVYLMIAISYFNIDNAELFDVYINKLTDKKMRAIKYYWLTINNILKDDFLTANINYNNFKDSKNDLSKKYSFEYFDEILNSLLNLNSSNRIHLIKNKINNEKVLQYINKQ